MLNLHFVTVLARRALESPGGIVKRSLDDTKDALTLTSPLSISLILLNILVLVPFFLYLCYTLGDLSPTLAIVEKQPRFEQEYLLEDDGLEGDASKEQPKSIEESLSPNLKPITASVRGIHRLLWSIGGLASLFRHYRWFLSMSLVDFAVTGFMSSIPYFPIGGGIVGGLMTVSLRTAWVNMVISKPSKKTGVMLLPGFKKAFIATAGPTTIINLVSYGSSFIIILLVPLNAVSKANSTAVALWQPLVIIVLELAVCAFFYIPAQAILVRIQASLFSAQWETIVPVDRTFGVEGVRERGYLTIGEAFQSLKGDWAHIYKVQVKLFFLSLAGFLFLGAILVGEVVACSQYLRR